MNKVFITGTPGIGKSTLIKQLINLFLKREKRLDGFLTPEVRVEGKRIGFNLERIATGEIVSLARINQPHLAWHIGRYGVFVDKFERFIEKLRNFELSPIDIFILDEIGKMELLSSKFCTFVLSLMKSKMKVIATIGKSMIPKFMAELDQNRGFKVYELTRTNRNKIFKQVSSIFR